MPRELEDREEGDVRAAQQQVHAGEDEVPAGLAAPSPEQERRGGEEECEAVRLDHADRQGRVQEDFTEGTDAAKAGREVNGEPEEAQQAQHDRVDGEQRGGGAMTAHRE